jgi:cold shock CspA family protein
MSEGKVKWFNDSKGFVLSSRKAARMFSCIVPQSREKDSNH